MNDKTIIKYTNSLGTITFGIDESIWVTDIDNVSSVEVSVSSSQGVSQIGSSVSAQSVQAGSITVNGIILANLETNRNKLISIVAPGVESKLIVIENGVSWYKDVIPTTTPIIDDGVGAISFQFKCYAAFPYWRTLNNSEIQAVGVSGIFKFPFDTSGTWKLSEQSEEMFVKATNSGNVDVNPEILFKASGSVENPQLLNATTGQLISFNLTITAGEYIDVSTAQGAKTISYRKSDGTTENGFKYLVFGSDMSFSLAPGENTLKADADSGRGNLSVVVTVPSNMRSGL